MKGILNRIRGNKKVLVIIFVFFLFACVGMVVFFVRKPKALKKRTVVETSTAISPSPQASEALELWDDPSGFSFRYPKGLSVDKHDEDKENYAHVEFTHADHKGSVIVWAKDTTAATIADWLKGEKGLKDSASIDTTLGGYDAKKISVKGTAMKQVTAALDDDVVVYVEATVDEDGFWQGINDTIVKTFAFTATAPVDNEAIGSSSEESPPLEADEQESIE